MSGIMKSSLFFAKKVGSYSDGWGEVTAEDRTWEQAYRDRWAHDKIVRSTHGVNCTGSCSWQVYVKDGIVVWETQEIDYPPTPPGVPNHEPRGCPRGASYSWYLYSASRVKHPLIRAELKAAWEEARKTMKPMEAWASIVENPEVRKSYTAARGLGGLVRTTSTIGTATCRRLLLRLGANRPTFRNPKPGTTRATSLFGVPTSQ